MFINVFETLHIGGNKEYLSIPVSMKIKVQNIIIHLWPLSIDLWSSPFFWVEQIIYRKLFVKFLHILKSCIQFILWLKRSPKTREVLSSSLSSDIYFSCNFIACIDV